MYRTYAHKCAADAMHGPELRWNPPVVPSDNGYVY
jgi:hypothetical protein